MTKFGHWYPPEGYEEGYPWMPRLKDSDIALWEDWRCCAWCGAQIEDRGIKVRVPRKGCRITPGGVHYVPFNEYVWEEGCNWDCATRNHAYMILHNET